MMFNSIERELQRFNDQRKYQSLIQESKKIKLFYPPSRQPNTKYKSKLTQINEELEEKTKTILHEHRYRRKNSQTSSEFSDHTVSKKPPQQIAQTLSPIQFSKELNRKSNKKQSPQQMAQTLSPVQIGKYIHKKQSKKQFISPAPQPEEQSDESYEQIPIMKNFETKSEKAMSFGGEPPIKSAQKDAIKEAVKEAQQTSERKEVEKTGYKGPSTMEKKKQKQEIMALALIVLGIILMIIQIFD